MSNQVILWGTLLIPWLSLLLMKKEEIKRYISVGLLSTILCIIAIEAGIRFNWWVIRETTYPLSILPTYVYGFFPVLPMWLFKFTNKRFGLYLAVDTVLNIIFAYVVLPWFAQTGIIYYYARLNAFILETIITVILYGFQSWQEGRIDK